MPPFDATTPDNAPSFTLAEFVAGVSKESLTPGFYRKNPFRQLGLPVLAGSREILKRTDELKLAAELGSGPAAWAFAPGAPLSLDEIRAAAQILKHPPDRLLHEFFWFWPERYPHEGADPAIESLARDAASEAGERWSAAAAAGSEVAWHNLAVYHHLLALAWEQEENCDETALADVWQQALNYWLQVIDHEKIWDRVLARVGLLGDAQLTVESVARLQSGVAEAVAHINATLAFHHAEQDRPQRVALHLSLVQQVFAAEPARAARALEVVARPAARRIEVRIEKARQDNAATPGAGLQTATALVQETARDFGLLETLCGRAAEFYREHARLLAAIVLESVVRYQRETADDRACLPLLWFLRDVPVTPELWDRIVAAQTVIQANAIEPKPDASDGETPGEPGARWRENILRLVVETMIPGLDELGLTATARQAYAVRLGDWLRTLALEACTKEEGIDWAVQALETSLTLPCDADTLAALTTAHDYVRNEFQLRRERALRIANVGHTLVIDVRGIALNDRWLTPGNITGIRHGIVTSEGGKPPRHVFAWRSADSDHEVSEANLLSSPESAAGDHGRILDAAYFFLVPPLIERLVGKLRAGEHLSVGDAQFDRSGAKLTTSSGTRLWKRTVLVPYHDLSYRFEGQLLKLTSLENPKLVETVDMLQTWNAVIIGYVIDRLARE